MPVLRQALLSVGNGRLEQSAATCWRELQNLQDLYRLFFNPGQLEGSCFTLVQLWQIFNSLHFLTLS